MAVCDVQQLADDAKCFFGVAKGAESKALILQLLCEINAALANLPAAGSVFYTFGNWGVNDDVPEDGTVLTQGAWNLDTGHAYVNTNWPDTANPTWESH